jgi:hypothetical protein
MRYCILLILLLSELHCSAQDTLIHKGKAYRIISNMLDDYPPYRDAVDSLQRRNSHLWCIYHYKTRWLVENDSLFLTSLTDECLELEMQYGKILGKSRTFAWWIDKPVFICDTLPLPCGFNSGIKYYPRERVLYFSSGVLYNERLNEYDDHSTDMLVYGYKITNCETDTVLRHVYASIDWSQIPDSILDESSTITVSFSTQQYYPWFANVKIRKSCCPTLDKYILKAIRKLDFPQHFRLGMYMPFYYTLKIRLNRDNKQRGEKENDLLYNYIQLRTR